MSRPWNSVGVWEAARTGFWEPGTRCPTRTPSAFTWGTEEGLRGQMWPRGQRSLSARTAMHSGEGGSLYVSSEAGRCTHRREPGMVCGDIPICKRGIFG